MAICKSCGTEIEFVRTKNEKRMPVSGKYMTVVTDNGEVVSGRESHFATCPGAAEHRKK